MLQKSGKITIELISGLLANSNLPKKPSVNLEIVDQSKAKY